MGMHRTQILLEDRQYGALKALARRAEKSLGEAVRLAVDRLLGLEARPRRGGRLGDICAIIKDPGGPSGAEHDRILYGPDR